MTVKFREFWKMRDIIARIEEDTDLARIFSRVVIEWNLEDEYTGDPMPLPEPDTSEWYEQTSYAQWTELVNVFIAERDVQVTVPN